MVSTRKKYVLIALLIMMSISLVPSADARSTRIERKILKSIASHQFRQFQADQRCRAEHTYRVYVIDNFQEFFYIVPEVSNISR